GMSMLSLVDVWWKLIGVAVVFSFGHGITRPPLTSILMTKAPPQRRGGVLGATTSIESFSRIIAPIMGGYIIQISPPAIGWIGGIFFTLAVLIAASLYREHRRQMS
ncbi:MAG: MFS transporter, partial [Acidobacteriota bacterium]